MNTSVETIALSGLLWALIPTIVVIGMLYHWALDSRSVLHAGGRMLVQLLLIGYVLTFIFEAKHAGVIMVVLGIMLIAASWIALRPIQRKKPTLYRNTFVAIVIGGMLTLALMTQVVLDVQPWYLPRYVVPLAGIIFAGAMNTVSLAAERFEAEHLRTASYRETRHTAFQSSLIPVLNSLFAVGLVALPGMMTGHILSGVSPLVAARSSSCV